MSISALSVARTVLAGLTLSVAGVSASADALASNFSFKIVETDTAGQESLVARDAVKPGEIIHYQLRHDNMTDSAMAGLVIAAPIPDGVTVTLGSEASSVPAVFEIQAELDPEVEGLEWSTLPAMRKVANEDGTISEEEISESAITAVRWSFSEPLAAGEFATNAYRVRVN